METGEDHTPIVIVEEDVPGIQLVVLHKERERKREEEGSEIVLKSL